MRTYELALILHPDLEIDLNAALKKVEALISGAQGQIKSQDNWGKQKLSYPVSKQDYGIYVFYTIELENTASGQLEEALWLEERILRHLLVVLDEKAQAALAAQATARAEINHSDRDKD